MGIESVNYFCNEHLKIYQCCIALLSNSTQSCVACLGTIGCEQN